MTLFNADPLPVTTQLPPRAKLPRKPAQTVDAGDFFQPRAESASLVGNHVTHLPEAPVVAPWATPAQEAEANLRRTWAAKGVSKERQDAMIAEIDAKAQPGASVGPFTIPSWDSFARAVAAKHALRDDPCECGACRYVSGK